MQYHPDVCKDSDHDTGVEFQKINIAYHVRELANYYEYSLITKHFFFVSVS